MNINDDYLKMFENMTSTSDFRSYNRTMVQNDEVEEFTFGEPKEETSTNSSLPNQMVPIDESVHFKKYKTNRIHRYSEAEMEEIRLSCKNTIVNDYGSNDLYHMSDEDKMKNDQLAEIAIKLASVKSIYRRLDQYIEAMRIVYKAWDLLSEKNFIHSKKEFFKLIGKGKIVSNRIIIPQMKNIKKYNLELIIKYISNPELDASIFAPEDQHQILEDNEETEKERINRLFDIDEIKIISDYQNNQYGKIQVESLPDKFIKHYLQPNSNKKKTYHQSVFNQIMNENRKVMTLGDQYTFSSGILDKEKQIKLYDRVKFKGSWRNDSDVKYYNMMIDYSHLDDRYDKWHTHGDIYINNFYTEMDSVGVSWRQSSSDLFKESKEQNHKMSIKENKKLEKEILQRIVDINKDEKFKQLAKEAENKLNKFMEKGEETGD